MAALVIGAIAVAFLVWNLDVDQFMAAIRQVSYGLLFFALPTYAFSFVFRAMRWRRLLLPLIRIPYKTAFGLWMLGFGVQNALPGRTAELARSIATAHVTRSRFSPVLATVVVERTFDAVALVIAVLALPFFYEVPGWVERMGRAGILLVVVATAMLILLHEKGPDVARWLTRHKGRIRRWIARFLHGFAGGLSALTPGQIVRVVAGTAAIWACELGSAYLALDAFHLEPRPGMVILLVSVLNLGSLIPNPPFSAGTYQALVVAALGAFGVGFDTALGFAVVYSVLQLSWSTLLGLYYLHRQGMALGRFQTNDP